MRRFLDRILIGGLVALVLVAMALLPSRAQLGMTGVGSGGFGVAAGCGAFPTLTNLLGDYRANTGVTGSPVTAVVNQANPGTNNLANSGTVPFNATSGYNSKPAFDFAVANDAALTTASFPTGVGGAMSVFVVGRMGSSTANFGGAASYGLGVTSDFNTAGASALVTRNATNSEIATADTLTGTLTNTMSADANHRFGAIYATSGTIKAQYVDNVVGANTSGSGITFVSNGTLAIGNRFLSGAVGGAAWDGAILHVVIGNAAWDSTERNNLDTWFTCTYGT